MLTALHFVLFLSASANSGTLSPATALPSAFAPSPVVLSACAHARYRSLCLRTLRPLPPSSSPSAIALAATLASLSATTDAAAFVSRAPSAPEFRDCARLLLDADEQLARAADELARLGGTGAPTRLGNAQTWTSAAMTDQDMCSLEIAGLERPMRDAVAARVAVASRLTSNALYLITRLASTSGGRNR